MDGRLGAGGAGAGGGGDLQGGVADAGGADGVEAGGDGQGAEQGCVRGETLGGDLTPRMLYRVHPDGSKELVRGAVFDELDNRSLRSDVLAVGDDAYVSQTLGPIPETTIAPSLLFGDIGGEAGERGAAEAAVLCGAEVRMS